MKTVKSLLAAILFAGLMLLLVLTISRPILIPPGAKNVVSLEWGWREFDYKGSRYIQSPMGYMAPVKPDHVGQVLDIIDEARKRVE